MKSNDNIDDNKNIYKLMSSEEPNWENIAQLIEKSTQKQIINEVSGFPNNYNLLHLACFKKSPLSIFELLCDKAPGLMKGKDSKVKMLPIEAALQNGCNLDIIQYLVDRDNYKIGTRNHDGFNLLDSACIYGESLDIIKFLVEREPDSLNARSDKKITRGLRLSPLHCLFLGKKQFSLETLEYLIEKGATVSKKYDLITIACHSQTLTLPIFKFLIENQTVQEMRRHHVSGKHKKGTTSHQKLTNHLGNYRFPSNLDFNEPILNELCGSKNPNLGCIMFMLEKGTNMQPTSAKNIFYSLTKNFSTNNKLNFQDCTRVDLLLDIFEKNHLKGPLIEYLKSTSVLQEILLEGSKQRKLNIYHF